MRRLFALLREQPKLWATLIGVSLVMALLPVGAAVVGLGGGGPDPGEVAGATAPAITVISIGESGSGGCVPVVVSSERPGAEARTIERCVPPDSACLLDARLGEPPPESCRNALGLRGSATMPGR